jgi:Fibronectin type III domain
MVTAAAGEQSATVRWQPATDTVPVHRYHVVASPGGESTTVHGTQTSALVTGLQNRRRYTFTVAASNSAGQAVSSPSNPVWPGDDVPAYLFPTQLAYLLVLLALVFLYAFDQRVLPGQLASLRGLPRLRDMLPSEIASVPISIPWFGALGAVVLSLSGIFYHGHRDWQRGFAAWHISRPLLGAVMASVGYLIFIGVIRATGASVPMGPQAKLVYFSLAFVIGFREELFRDIIKRMTDLLFGRAY